VLNQVDEACKFRLSLVSATAQSELWNTAHVSGGNRQRLAPNQAKSSDWAVAETKREIWLHFLAHLRLNLVLGSATDWAKKWSHPITALSDFVTSWRFYSIGSTSQSLARGLSPLCEISCVALQSSRQSSHKRRLGTGCRQNSSNWDRQHHSDKNSMLFCSACLT